ncbi:hypothetical protein WJX73_010445 [Symbiochloris irregularis]|uniref:Myb-like domain-containing protein n=1 Tax=Symbiochloris irregularis TaxID=706552 RepID=A0AAW1NTJ1_9CHLO
MYLNNRCIRSRLYCSTSSPAQAEAVGLDASRLKASKVALLPWLMPGDHLVACSPAELKARLARSLTSGPLAPFQAFQDAHVLNAVGTALNQSTPLASGHLQFSSTGHVGQDWMTQQPPEQSPSWLNPQYHSGSSTQMAHGMGSFVELLASPDPPAEQPSSTLTLNMPIDAAMAVIDQQLAVLDPDCLHEESASDSEPQAASQGSKRVSGSTAAQISRASKVQATQPAPHSPSQPKFQVSRSGRVRVPPVAFWANQRVQRDPQTGELTISGFADQLSAPQKPVSPKGRAGAKPSRGAYQPGPSRSKAAGGASQESVPAPKAVAHSAAGSEDDSDGGGDVWADEDSDEEAEDVWNPYQVAALKVAYLREEDPAKPGFWASVAKHVPGKSAQACFAKLYEGHPTPAAACKAPKPRRYLAAAQMGPKPSASMTAAAGAGRKLPPAATRKWAREARWHQRAAPHFHHPDADADADGSALHPQAAANGQRKGTKAEQQATGEQLPADLLEAMERQERADRYIDALVARRGHASTWAGQDGLAELDDGVQDSVDEDSEKDYYFSD